MAYRIVTIGRQFGSGGHEIGERLAKVLGLSFYDTLLIDLAVDYGNVDSEQLKQADEKRPGSLIYSLFEASNAKTGYHLPVQDAMYNLQSGVIRSLAEKEPCIIVGRCADYILKGRKDTISVFIYADTEYRIDRICGRDKCSRKDAISRIKKTDKNRSYYYNYYTDQKWGDMGSYDLSLNSSKLGIDGCVEILSKLIKKSGD